MRLDCWKVALFAGFVGVLGCGADDGDFTDQMPDDLPAGQGTGTSGDTTSTSSSSTSADGGSSSTGESECQSSEDCLGQDVCVASWDPDTQTHGPSECAFACIPSFDDAQWCADASACCDANAICTDRGYCVPPQDPGGDTGSTSGGSTGDGGSTGGDTSTGGTE